MSEGFEKGRAEFVFEADSRDGGGEDEREAKHTDYDLVPMTRTRSHHAQQYLIILWPISLYEICSRHSKWNGANIKK